tara:strand:+ start:111 stop:1253 length:1143 start_codon:yes stop_codon:yes gene_type:complete
MATLSSKVTPSGVATAAQGTLADSAVQPNDSPTFNAVTTTSLVVNGNNYPSAGPLSNRNLIVNSAMQVAQRGTSTGATGAAYYGPDRFRFTVGSAGVGTYTISQDTNAPDGFGYSYKLDCTTADAAPDASDAVFVATRFEGQDLQQFKKGTASAESVTLSFWVKSNLTGTYQVNLFDFDNTRIIGATYAISAADTWEQKTITFAGDTTGAFTNDNNLSFQVEWALDGGTDYTSGAVPTAWETATNADRAAGLTINIADNTANYWQITGVQLEVGDTATSFEHRSYGDELAKCQRYYFDASDAGLLIDDTANAFSYSSVYSVFPTTMRTSPSMTVSNTASLNIHSFIANYKRPTGFALQMRAQNTGRFYVLGVGYTADAEL